MTKEYTDTEAIMGACWAGDQADYLFHLLDEEDDEEKE